VDILTTLAKENGEGKIRVHSITKTDGRISDVLGTKVYTLFLSAEVEFLEDIHWRSSSPFMVQETPKSDSRGIPDFSEFFFVASGLKSRIIEVKAGEGATLSVQVYFERRERGWVWIEGPDTNANGITATLTSFNDRFETRIAEEKRRVEEEEKRVEEEKRKIAEAKAEERRRQEEEGQREREARIDRLESLVGKWSGTYVAKQGEVGATVKMTEVAEDSEQVRGIFWFYNLPGQSNSKNGAFEVFGTLSDGGEVTFRPGRWIEQPSGYRYFGFTGILDESSQTVRGEIRGLGSIFLEREE